MNRCEHLCSKVGKSSSRKNKMRFKLFSSAPYRNSTKMVSSTSSAPLPSIMKMKQQDIERKTVIVTSGKSTNTEKSRKYFCDVIIIVDDISSVSNDNSKKEDDLDRLFSLFRSHISQEPFRISFPSSNYKTFENVVGRIKSLPKYTHSVVEFNGSYSSPIICSIPKISFSDLKSVTFRNSLKAEKPTVLLGCLTFFRVGKVVFENLKIEPLSAEDCPFVLIIRESGCDVNHCKIHGEIEVRECFDVKRCVEFKSNEIYDSPSVGLYVESSYVDISKNIIHSHKANGINIGSSEGYIMNNEIFNNGDPGIYFKDGTDCIVQNNKIYENLSNGINVANDSSSIFIGNEIWGNEHPGFYVKENSNPKVVDNIFRDSNSNAINIDGARGTYEHNVFYSNSAPVFFVKNGANPIFRNNRISRNPTNAIVLENSFGKFYNNEISDIRTECPAIYIDHSSVEFIGNTLKKNEGIGFYLTNRSIGIFQKNVVKDHESSAFSVEGKSEPVIVGNTIKRISGNALLMEQCSSGRFEKNIIREVKDYPCVMMTYCRSISVIENVFKGSFGDICICCNYSTGRIEGNKFGKGILASQKYAIDEASKIECKE